MWKDGKQWVYSVTYDEGLEGLLDHTVPINEEFGIPGNISLVADQVGVSRNVPGSSFHGERILNKDQIDSLIDDGWGVSCHSMTHSPITSENAEFEVVEARGRLEEQLGRAVEMFIVNGSNQNYPAAREVAEEAGYTSMLTLWDAVNTMSTELLRLHRTPLVDEGHPPFYDDFDPYRRLHQAKEMNGWVIDYTHIARPRSEMVSPPKEISVENLRARFEKVHEVGGDDVWLAEPTEVVKYIRQNR